MVDKLVETVQKLLVAGDRLYDALVNTQCFCKTKVCVINFKADDRYSETMLSTHDKQMIPCIMGFSMEEIMQIPECYGVSPAVASVILAAKGCAGRNVSMFTFMQQKTLKSSCCR